MPTWERLTSGWSSGPGLRGCLPFVEDVREDTDGRRAMCDCEGDTRATGRDQALARVCNKAQKPRNTLVVVLVERIRQHEVR